MMLKSDSPHFSAVRQLRCRKVGKQNKTNLLGGNRHGFQIKIDLLPKFLPSYQPMLGLGYSRRPGGSHAGQEYWSQRVIYLRDDHEHLCESRHCVPLVFIPNA